MRWQHRELPESFKENLNPAEQQVNGVMCKPDLLQKYLKHASHMSWQGTIPISIPEWEKL